MDDSTSQKISDVLKDPEMLSKIASVVGNLTQGSEPAQTTSAPSGAAPLLSALSMPQNSNETALLSALKPLLGKEKQQKVDKLINALAIAAIVKSFKKGEGGDSGVQQ